MSQSTTQTEATQLKGSASESAVLNHPPLNHGLGRLFVLFAVVIGLACGIAWVTWSSSVAMVGLLAGLVCFAAAIAGHYASQVPRGDIFIMARLMMSTTVRLGLPLMLLVVCKTAFPELFQRGMVYFVILFYLVGLSNDLATQMGRLNQLKAASATGSPESNMANPASGNS